MGGALARSAAAAAALAWAASVEAAGDRPWYVPDHAKLQLAGNVGFLSPGVGWALARRLDADVFLGWVPAAVGGDDIFSVTGKITWAPWSIGAGRWDLRPLSAGLQATYTFGEEYFVVPRFPFVPTALRGGLALGASASRPLGERRVGLYAELVALDIPFAHWLSNRNAIDATDVFSLAFGARLDF